MLVRQQGFLYRLQGRGIVEGRALLPPQHDLSAETTTPLLPLNRLLATLLLWVQC